ncbi:MAG: signal peptidase II [Cellvibrionaceae bacterium]|jgi:signal peptidase II
MNLFKQTSLRLFKQASLRLFKQKSLWLCLALVVFIFDQVTKNWAASVLAYSDPQSFLPFFNFTLLHNYGAAFSFLSDAGGWQRWFFGIVAFAVSILLIVWICKLERSKKIELAGLSLVLGGALGNLYDRIVLGYVIDFVDWFYSSAESCLPFFYGRPELQTCHWPAFNIADSSILLGVSLLIVDMLFFNQNRADAA